MVRISRIAKNKFKILTSIYTWLKPIRLEKVFPEWKKTDPGENVWEILRRISRVQ